MRRKTHIAAEYDYYTLDQAREIFKREIIETVKTYLIVSLPVLFIFGMILHWILIGY